jgi:hypothetical protein
MDRITINLLLDFDLTIYMCVHCIAGVLGLALRRSMGALQGSDLDQGEVQQPCDAHRRERYTYIYAPPVHQLSVTQINDHYRNPRLCRVLASLPSAFCRALGKEGFAECRTR